MSARPGMTIVALALVTNAALVATMGLRIARTLRVRTAGAKPAGEAA